MRLAREKGLSLVEVIVAVCVLGVAGVAGMRLIQSQMSAQKFVEGRSDRDGIRMSLLSKINCAKTVLAAPAHPCTPGTRVALLDAGSNVLVPAAGRVMGSWVVQAQCDTGAGFRVLLAQPRNGSPWFSQSASDFRKEPVSGLPLSWSHPKSTVIGGSASTASLCSAEFGAGPTPTPVAGAKYCATPGQMIVGIDADGSPLCQDSWTARACRIVSGAPPAPCHTGYGPCNLSAPNTGPSWYSESIVSCQPDEAISNVGGMCNGHHAALTVSLPLSHHQYRVACATFTGDQFANDPPYASSTAVCCRK